MSANNERDVAAERDTKQVVNRPNQLGQFCVLDFEDIEMRLLTGPPGPGKSRTVLGQISQALKLLRENKGVEE